VLEAEANVPDEALRCDGAQSSDGRDARSCDPRSGRSMAGVPPFGRSNCGGLLGASPET